MKPNDEDTMLSHELLRDLIRDVDASTVLASPRLKSTLTSEGRSVSKSGYLPSLLKVELPLLLRADRPHLLSWSWLFGQLGSEVKVYSGC